jgi:hypothetical protein
LLSAVHADPSPFIKKEQTGFIYQNDAAAVMHNDHTYKETRVFDKMHV